MSSAPRTGALPGAGRTRERWLLVVVAAVVVAGQLLPHPPNVTPVRAAALFGGARLGSRAAAFLATLGSFFLASLALGLATGNWSTGFHALAPVVYTSFALSLTLGFALRSRQGMAPIAVASVAGSVVFYVLTNLAVWGWLDTYPKTPEGLPTCFLAGLPPLVSGLLGDGAYAALLVGGLPLAERALGLRHRARATSAG